jgi:RecB family exonuclease
VGFDPACGAKRLQRFESVRAAARSANSDYYSSHAQRFGRGAGSSRAGANQASFMPSENPIELAEPVDHEPARGIRPQVQHFSASSLNTYVDCRRKWFYNYVCRAVEDPGSSAALYGTAFHAALEDFHQEFVQPLPTQEAAMRERIQQQVAWAFERFRAGFGSAVEFTLQLRRAQRTAQRYVGWLVERAARAPFTVIGRELPASLQIEGYDFIGYIDRLDKNDATGAVSIVDYKTGSIATSAAEYREKVRQFRDFQLPFYYWAREAEGDRVATLALIPLKDALLDVEPIELEIVPVARDDARNNGKGQRKNGAPYGPIPIEELERARERMGAICKEIMSATVEHFPVTKNPDACTFCAYVLACNDRPAPIENGFGR